MTTSDNQNRVWGTLGRGKAWAFAGCLCCSAQVVALPVDLTFDFNSSTPSTNLFDGADATDNVFVRWNNIATDTTANTAYDLVATVVDYVYHCSNDAGVVDDVCTKDYGSGAVDMSGVTGDFGKINIRVDSLAQFEFVLYEHNTLTEANANFDLWVLDIDAGGGYDLEACNNNHKGKCYDPFSGLEALQFVSSSTIAGGTSSIGFAVAPNSELVDGYVTQAITTPSSGTPPPGQTWIAPSSDSTTPVWSAGSANDPNVFGGDNPQDATAMTPKQVSRVVQMSFTDTSRFSLNLSVGGGPSVNNPVPQGRNFLFAGEGTLTYNVPAPATLALVAPLFGWFVAGGAQRRRNGRHTQGSESIIPTG